MKAGATAAAAANRRSKVQHVNFVIHGMGSQENERGTFKQNLKDLRETCKSCAREEFSLNDQDFRVEWIPIEWHSKLHSLDTVGSRLNSITLPTCSIVRTICNDILSDGFFYFSSFHGQEIINLVTSMLNDEIAKFKQENPKFDGSINIVAHSLGAIISYDLLANQKDDSPPLTSAHLEKLRPKFPQQETHRPLIYPKLNFKVDNLFALGSPIGATLVQRGQSFSSYRLKDTAFYNLFNLYDPVAYRIEPLLDERYLEIAPVLLQRPSAIRAGKQYEFTYYKEMIFAYLPDLSLPNLKFEYPKIDIPKMPQMPPIPDFGITSSLTEVGNSMQSVKFPNFPFSSNPSISFSRLPDIPILSNAQEAFKSQFSSMVSSLSSVSSVFNGSAELDDDLFLPTGSKRRRHNQDDIGHAQKKREVAEDDGKVSSTIIDLAQSSSLPPSQSSPSARKRSADKQALHARPIKDAISVKSSKSKKDSPSRNVANARVFSYISSFFSYAREDAVEAQTSQKPYSSTEMESNVTDLGEKLTKELVAAANQAKKKMEEEEHSSSNSKEKKHERFDYFVQEKTMVRIFLRNDL